MFALALLALLKYCEDLRIRVLRSLELLWSSFSPARAWHNHGFFCELPGKSASFRACLTLEGVTLLEPPGEAGQVT